jgi:hypothetical protein
VGYEPSSGDGLRFTLDDLPLVERFFANVERYVLDNALVFRDPEPLLRFTHPARSIVSLSGRQTGVTARDS